MLKIMTKILAEIVKNVLDDLIDESQSAFIPGRCITHNIAVATEISKGYGRKDISARYAIKVDLHKAYDSINWSFIARTL